MTVGFWNAENLFDLVDDPNKNDEEFSIGGRKNVTSDIYDLKIKHSAEILFDLNVDVLGLCEVENLKVLKDLNRSYPNRNYDIIHYDSPDERGIDNALLYDRSRFTVLKSKVIPNTLYNNDKSRDILHVMGQFQSDTLHLFVNHWPSRSGGEMRYHDENIVSQFFDLQFRPFEKLYSTFGLRSDDHTTVGRKTSGKFTAFLRLFFSLSAKTSTKTKKTKQKPDTAKEHNTQERNPKRKRVWLTRRQQEELQQERGREAKKSNHSKKKRPKCMPPHRSRHGSR